MSIFQKRVTKCRKSVNLTLDQVQMDFNRKKNEKSRSGKYYVIVGFLDFTDRASLSRFSASWIQIWFRNY